MSPFLNLEILCDNPDAAKLRDMNITTVNREEYRLGFVRLDDITAIYPRHIAEEGTIINLRNGETIVTTINTHDLWTLLNDWESEKRNNLEYSLEDIITKLIRTNE